MLQAPFSLSTSVHLRPTIHSMLWRCRNWNYRGTWCYMITLVLNDRSRPVLGRLAADRPEIELSELGRRVKAHFWRIAEFMPQIVVLGVQVMPEHQRRREGDCASGVATGGAGGGSEEQGVQFAVQAVGRAFRLLRRGAALAAHAGHVAVLVGQEADYTPRRLCAQSHRAASERTRRG